MSLLRRIRAELAGVRRSVRYDLGRRPVPPPARGPDMTSTGMNTFGGYVVDHPGFDTFAPGGPALRPRRRAAAVTGLGVLTVVGAAGAYLAVVNGLGSLMNETEASAGTLPPRPAVTGTIAPVTGIGGGPAPRRAATGTPRPAKAKARTTPPTIAPPRKHNMSPIQTINPANPLRYPPVPTPTEPAPPPRTTAGPAPSATTPSPIAQPSGSPEPSGSDATPSDPPEARQGRHHRRHRETAEPG